MKKRTHNLLAVIIGLILLALDQLTKLIAVRTVKVNGAKVLIDGVFEFRYLENRGAAWGMMNGARILFVVIALVITALVIWVYAKLPAEKKYMPLRICLVLLASGALGNMIDRFMHAYVVDFIYVSLIDFPIFNVADIYVTCAAILLIVLVLFVYKEEDLQFLGGKKKKAQD